ncbi:MAG: DUF3836 domain-containing protein [Bacteroidales bacterium]|nr:DUF3836 domain-containing protein [Bacteroidales bacterium]
MKTVSIKAIMSIFALASMITFANAANSNDKHVYNNDVVENGKIVVREVCSEENGLLTLKSRSEMEYTDNGRLAVKRDFSWNAESSSWVFVRSVSYSYSEDSYTITYTDAKGNTSILLQSK